MQKLHDVYLIRRKIWVHKDILHHNFFSELTAYHVTTFLHSTKLKVFIYLVLSYSVEHCDNSIRYSFILGRKPSYKIVEKLSKTIHNLN